MIDKGNVQRHVPHSLFVKSDSVIILKNFVLRDLIYDVMIKKSRE